MRNSTIDTLKYNKNTNMCLILPDEIWSAEQKKFMELNGDQSHLPLTFAINAISVFHFLFVFEWIRSGYVLLFSRFAERL